MRVGLPSFKTGAKPHPPPDDPIAARVHRCGLLSKDVAGR
jgi:hypothetical protein